MVWEESLLNESALVCGLDVHKESTYATILDANGKIVNQKRMSNSLVPSYLSTFKIDRIGMESNNQIVPLYRLLTRKGYDVSVSHPKKTRYIAEAKIKSDRVDSKAIAELVRLDALPSAYIPDPETAILREKIRRRAFLVRERVRLRAKTKSLLTYEGIDPPIRSWFVYGERCRMASLFGPRACRIIPSNHQAVR